MGFDEGEDNRTIYCGNLSEEVLDSVLYELFNQAGPVESVRRPKDPSGRPKSFAFIIYKHECSVPYALEVFRQTKLCNRNLNLNSRSRLHHIPVLDSHLSEFDNAGGQVMYMNGPGNQQGHGFRDNHRNREDTRHERNSFRSERGRASKREREKDPNEPTSWAELNALKGKGSVHNGHVRSDLQTPTEHRGAHNSMNMAQSMPDFNALLQMGQQMMIPGMMGMLGSPFGLGLGAGLNGLNMLPMPPPGGPSERGQRGRSQHQHQGDRRGHRTHPYSDQPARQDHWEDHRRHDRGYSSSRSSHDRERRERSRR